MNAVDALNSAFKADPDAIRALMVNRVPCNRMLADHEFVQVDLDKHLDGEHFNVGAIGLINAVMAAHGLPLVATKWDIREEGPNTFIGFCNYEVSVGEGTKGI